MPISWRANGKQRVDLVFSDPYSAPESESVMKQVFADASLGRPLRFLVDVRHSAPPDTEFVCNAILFWQMHVRNMWDAKVAVVAATDRQVEMGEISERTAASRELPFTVRVFHESQWDEAELWLGARR
jgi:hypothetical protein